MTSAALIAACRRAGVRLWIEDGGLRYSCGAGTFPPDLRAALLANRDAAIAGLRRVAAAQILPCDQWSADDRERYEERAAIREFDGGQSRADAERDAEADVRKEFMREAGDA